MSIQFIKKLLLTFVILLGSPTLVYAMADGFYLGGKIQQLTLNSKSINTDLGQFTAGNQAIGLGLLLGFSFNTYAAFEFGFNYFNRVGYTVPPIFTQNNMTTQLSSLDFLGKGLFPFPNSGFTLFGKAGGTYIYARTSGQICIDTACTKVKNSTTLRPLIGFGVSYDFNQNWQTALSYSRIIYKTSYFSNPNIIALELTYHFVNKYCGQFLC